MILELLVAAGVSALVAGIPAISDAISIRRGQKCVLETIEDRLDTFRTPPKLSDADFARAERGAYLKDKLANRTITQDEAVEFLDLLNDEKVRRASYWLSCADRRAK